jgi:hypothetical protein
MHLAAFAAMFILDWVYAVYTRRVAEGRALPAASYAAVLYAISGSLTLAIVHDPRLLPAAIAGAFAGTYFSVRRDSK